MALRSAREADKRLRRADDLIRRDESAEVYAAISSAVRGYIADKMNRPEPGLTDGVIAEFLRGKGVGGDTIDRLFAILKVCDGARYSPEATSTDRAKNARGEAGALIESLEKGGLE
jgi:hypothetical protein